MLQINVYFLQVTVNKCSLRPLNGGQKREVRGHFKAVKYRTPEKIPNQEQGMRSFPLRPSHTSRQVPPAGRGNKLLQQIA